MTGPSQTLRVRDQLRIGPVTILDFDRQPAIDGGSRITRLARCVGDLKYRGYTIDSKLVAVGDVHVARYTLVSEPDVESDDSAGQIVTDALGTAQDRLKASTSLSASPAADMGEQGALFDIPDPASRPRQHFEEAA